MTQKIRTLMDKIRPVFIFTLKGAEFHIMPMFSYFKSQTLRYSTENKYPRVGTHVRIHYVRFGFLSLYAGVQWFGKEMK